MIAKLEDAKKVTTINVDGSENGFLIELFKDEEKTVVYLTVIRPGAFKGYHLHKIRSSRYICLKGKTKIILERPGIKEKEEYVLDGDMPQRLSIPKDIATGLLNIGDEDAWLVNFPDPPYDPNLKGEQVEYTKEELEKGIVK